MQKSATRIEDLKETFRQLTLSRHPIDFLLLAPQLSAKTEKIVSEPLEDKIEVVPYDLP